MLTITFSPMSMRASYPSAHAGVSGRRAGARGDTRRDLLCLQLESDPLVSVSAAFRCSKEVSVGIHYCGERVIAVRTLSVAAKGVKHGQLPFRTVRNKLESGTVVGASAYYGHAV